MVGGGGGGGEGNEKMLNECLLCFSTTFLSIRAAIINVEIVLSEDLFYLILLKRKTVQASDFSKNCLLLVKLSQESFFEYF